MPTSRKDFQYAVERICTLTNEEQRTSITDFMIKFFNNTGSGFDEDRFITILNKALVEAQGKDVKPYSI